MGSHYLFRGNRMCDFILMLSQPPCPGGGGGHCKGRQETERDRGSASASLSLLHLGAQCLAPLLSLKSPRGTCIFSPWSTATLWVSFYSVFSLCSIRPEILYSFKNPSPISGKGWRPCPLELTPSGSNLQGTLVSGFQTFLAMISQEHRV